MSATNLKKFYVASKATAHGPFWQQLRQEGWPIISTWDALLAILWDLELPVLPIQNRG